MPVNIRELMGREQYERNKRCKEIQDVLLQTWKTGKYYTKWGAPEFLEMILPAAEILADKSHQIEEQKAKMVAREIFEKVCDSFIQRIAYFDYKIYINEIVEQIKNIAKEYGVEL